MSDVVARAKALAAEWRFEDAGELVPELVAEVERLRAAIDRVRALHWPASTRDGACDCVDGLVPCPTVEALRTLGDGRVVLDRQYADEELRRSPFGEVVKDAVVVNPDEYRSGPR